MAIDIANVLGGPAMFRIATTQIGHTMGGISCTIKPQQHAVTVDQYGKTAMNFRHEGDEVKMKVPLAEYSAAVLAQIYDPGDDQTAAGGAKYMGFGRSAGYLYTAVAADIVPYVSADSAKSVQFWRVTPIGEITQDFNTDKDRITDVEFACMGDSTKTDGQLIGKINLTAS